MALFNLDELPRYNTASPSTFLIIGVLPKEHPIPSSWGSPVHVNISFDDFFSEFQQYDGKNWDGDDAEPISPETVQWARTLHDALPRDVQPPDISPGADGTIGFQWVAEQNGRRLFRIVDVGPGSQIAARIIDDNGRVSYFPTVSAKNLFDLQNLVAQLLREATNE